MFGYFPNPQYLIPDVLYEMLVLSAHRAVGVSVDALDDRTGPWQIYWIDGSAVPGPTVTCEWDGCDAAGKPWAEQTGGSEWGAGLSALDQAVQDQQGMPVVGVTVGVGVQPGRGITGLPVPKAQNVVQRWDQRVNAQSPPSVGSAEFARGAACNMLIQLVASSHL